MNPARGYDTASVLLNGTVLVTGGHNGSAVLNTATLYNPSTGTWTSTGSLNTRRNKHAAPTLLYGKVLISGRNYNGYRKEVELYDPLTGVWTDTLNMNTEREEYVLECPFKNVLFFFRSSCVYIRGERKKKRTFRPGTFLKGHFRLLPNENSPHHLYYLTEVF